MQAYRYFLHLAYEGSRYHGWQRQPHSNSVQETIETVLSTILGNAIELTGCGRTDSGVHASRYVAHFDTMILPPPDLMRRLNRMLPPDIAISHIEPMGPAPVDGEHGRHARFSATHRAYRYDLIRQKDAFRQNTAWHHNAFDQIDFDAMQEVAALLLAYQDFSTFCKTQSDAKTMRCELRDSRWERLNEGNQYSYHIAADRFLRGMVRLIVGACIRVGLGDQSLDDIRKAMDKKQPLDRALSAPPNGLFLTEVRYG